MEQPESNVIGSYAYDPRALLSCSRCMVMLPYRLLREGDRFLARHHTGFGVWVLGSRRPGWRSFHVSS